MTNFTPSGLILISGDPGSGKTTAGLFVNYLHAPTLKEIAYIHDDDKQLPFPASEYGAFLGMKSDKIKLFEYGKEITSFLASLDSGKIKAVVFDTWPKFGESIINYTVNHGNEFRERDAFIMRHEPKVIGAQTWRDAYNREGKVAAGIANKFGCLIAISHIKEDSRSGVKSNKMIEIASKQWKKSANARLWLINNGGGVPVVLVKKKFDKSWIDEGRPRTVNFLPQRLTPQQGDKSIWDMVNRYWHDPVDERPLTDSEKPIDEEEVAIIRDTWTKRQYDMWLKEMEVEKVNQAEKLAEQDAAILGLVQQMNGASFPEIQETVKSSFGRELSIGEIMEMRKQV